MSSRNIMMGYLNKPKDTKDTFDENGWLHSGDVGFEQEDGYFKAGKFTFVSLKVG